MSFLLLILIVLSILYNVFALFCVWKFFQEKRNPAKGRCDTPVSIIKPLKGIEAEFKENLETFCTQEYAAYEVLLGFTDPDDKAIDRLQEIATPCANCQVRTVISTKDFGANKKVSNLRGLVDAAAHPLLAMSDSDMRVDRFYLRNIVDEYYASDNAGLVTCLYKVSAPETAGAALESLTIALDFIPSVLVARRLEGVTFGLGASLLISKKALLDIGGLPAVADHLADDYQIGNRLWKKGYKIILSRVVIENVVGPMSIADYFRHQLRWARTYRVSRPHGYLGYGITHLFAFTLLFTVLEGPTVFSASLLGTALCLRLGLAALVSLKEIRSKRWLKWLVLLPIKDIAGFCLWVWSFMNNRVVWRKTTYAIRKDGTMVAAE